MRGQLFVISAPSGGGKSTIIQTLMERLDGVSYSVSHTSRAPRPGEREGIDYHFVDRETFEGMIQQNALVEWAQVYDEFYGTSLASLTRQTESGMDVLLDLDTQGAKNIRERFEDAVLIYLLPPSLEILKERLKNRGTDSADHISKRMEKAGREIENCLWYDYIVVNDDLERAVMEVQSILVAHRCKRDRMSETVSKLYGID